MREDDEVVRSLAPAFRNHALHDIVHQRPVEPTVPALFVRDRLLAGREGLRMSLSEVSSKLASTECFAWI